MKYFLIAYLFGNIFVFSQQKEANLNLFFNNENLAIKVRTISKFLDISSTVHYNDYNSEPFIINILPLNLGIRNDKIYGTLEITISRIDDHKLIFTNKYKCFKLDETKYVTVSFINESWNDIIKNFDSKEYDCNKVLPKVYKKDSHIPQSLFIFYLDGGFVYLSELATFDALEYLNLEFVDINK